MCHSESRLTTYSFQWIYINARGTTWAKKPGVIKEWSAGESWTLISGSRIQIKPDHKRVIFIEYNLQQSFYSVCGLKLCECSGEVKLVFMWKNWESDCRGGKMKDRKVGLRVNFRCEVCLCFRECLELRLCLGIVLHLLKPIFMIYSVCVCLYWLCVYICTLVRTKYENLLSF